MRVCHVIVKAGIGGAQVMLERYLRALGPVARNHRVVALMPGGQIGPRIAALGVPIEDLGMTSIWGLPRALTRLRGILERERPDIVHGRMYHGALVASLAVRKLDERKYGPRPHIVWSIHHSLADPRKESHSTRLILRAMTSLADETASICYCGRTIRVQHENEGFLRDRGLVIPNGIDCDLFRPRAGAGAELKAELGLRPETFLIGNVARNHPMKDHVMLVSALRYLLDLGVDAQLLIVGEGHQEGPARKAARRFGIDNHLTTLAARENVNRLVAGLDAFALSSAWGEAFPLSLGEAMASGVPSVATDVGDTGWLLGDPSRIIAPEDARNMATKLGVIARMTPEYRATLGARDRDRVLQNFSLERFVAAYAAMYEEALRPSFRAIAAE